MQNNRDKILKLAFVLLGILIAVFVLTQISKHNSMTLEEYALEHPELNPPGTDHDDTLLTDMTGKSQSESRNHATEHIYGENTGSSNSEMDLSLDKGNSALKESASLNENSLKENLQSAGTSSENSELTGVILNGNSQENQRITYKEFFYYEPLSGELREYITGVSFPEAAQSTDNPSISYDELCYMHILHYNFEGIPSEGELICNKAIAQDLIEIFYELYRNEYQIEKVCLIEAYDGDDTLSMANNNTSCFNYRNVNHSSSLSKHALGLAIDINPLYNPYITYDKEGNETVSPIEAADYADRSKSFPYKIDENDLCYKLFIEHGFTWGGNWNSCKDYQHFQKVK